MKNVGFSTRKRQPGKNGDSYPPDLPAVPCYVDNSSQRFSLPYKGRKNFSLLHKGQKSFFPAGRIALG